MNRRQLSVALATIFTYVDARVQAGDRIRRLAFLSSGNVASGDLLNRALKSSLRTLGWLEGKNIIVDIRYAESDTQRLPRLTKELLDTNPDVFACSVDVYAKAAADATKMIPIVFVLGLDPVGLGMVESLARPGHNVTGFAVRSYELNSKRVSLLKEALPRLEKVAVLFREGDAGSKPGIELLRKAGQAVGVAIVPLAVRDRDDIPTVLKEAARLGVHGVVNVPEPLFFQEKRAIAELCIRHHLAASFAAAEYADAGMLMGYGVDFAAMYRRAAGLIDRVLRGASPATIPVEMADSYELVLNLKTAKAIGVEVPRSLLLQATRVIE